MTFIKVALTFLLSLCLHAVTIAQSVPSVSFTFSLSASARTSAGVFAQDGTLVRTLWSALAYSAGPHTQTWDGLDDQARPADPDTYDIRVLANNVTYTWEGVIANTSSNLSGNAKQRAFLRMQGMAITGSTAYFCTGYSEGNPAQAKFNLANPQQKIEFSPKGITGQASQFVATDGTNVYWGGSDPFAPTNTFVFATKTTDDTQASFSAGVALKTTYATYTSALDVTNSANSAVSGLAVQTRGAYLLVAHRALNQLDVLNKTTGVLVRRITVSAPRQLAIDGDDRLWMISATSSLQQFSLQPDGTLSTPLLSLTGLTEPLALAISPDNRTLLVADAGASQQLKAFDRTTGQPAWSLGQPGGYATDPLVSDSKFYFSDLSGGIHDTFLAFAPDGSFWVGDSGNYRVQHYSASRTWLERIMYMQHFYSSFVDANRPDRVFAEYLEFSVDYTKPLGPANGSWQLLRNWRAGIPADYYQDFTVNILKSVTTLSNGRTYALLFKIPTRQWAVVELPASGPVRFTGILLTEAAYYLTADGSLRTHANTGLGGSYSVLTQPLTGFDTAGNPRWGTAQLLASTPALTGEDPVDWYGEALRPGAATSSGVVVSFDKTKVGNGHGQGYHLGGIRQGESKWLWRAARATWPGYTGIYPVDGAYDVGNGVEYGGGDVTVIDRHIFWNYHGEFWKQSQVNKWEHLYDDGLVVGQFGVTGPEVAGQEAAPGMAGGVFYGTVVKGPSGNLYLWHSEEGGQAGLHRWQISGLETLSEQHIPVRLAARPTGLLAEYFEGRDLNNLRVVSRRVVATVVPAQQSGSVRWSGYVQPSYSEAYTFYASVNQGVRLWVDGQLVLDRWTNTVTGEYSSRGVTLQAGRRYALRLEISGGSAGLSWSSGNQVKQQLPTDRLWASSVADTTAGVDLLSGLPRMGVLADGLYGWHRDAVSEDSTSYFKSWKVRTDVKTYDRFGSPDLYMSFAEPGSTYQVRRDLGTRGVLSGWQLQGRLNQDGSTFSNSLSNGKSGGYYVDVLDDQEKVIARLEFQAYFGQAGDPGEVLGNRSRLAYGSYFGGIGAEASRSQGLVVSASEGKVTFQYASYSAVTTGLWDPLAHWQLPRTLRFYFWENGVNYPRVIDIEHMNFLPSPATPVTTTVVAGTGTGLAAEYFNNITLAAPAAASRTDATVDFNWRYDSPIPGTINADVFSVRWSGQVQAPVSGTYVFSDICDDGVRLRVNGTLVIDNWTSHANTDYSAPISLTAGQKYDLVMEYFEGYSGAKAQLLWAYPGQGQQVIPQSRLYPATLSTPVTTTVVAGTGTGLAAEYFNNITLAAPAAASRTDATVDFNWRYDSPIPGTINADVFSVRWSGQVQAPVSGTYVFSDICDDGVRLRVNGTLVIDNWTSHANTDYSAPISLTAGQKYDLVMEYFEGYSGAKAQLLWAYPGQGQQVIPQSRLYPATLSTPVTTTVVAGTGTGLAAEYFNNITLAAPAAASRTDATVDFNWRYDSPIPGTINADVFSVRWSGQVQAPVSGTYVFSDICDDGVRLRVNGTLVIDNWTSHANTDYSAPISLTAGQKYDLVMEYFEGYSGAKAQLLWAYPGQGQQVIPQSRLYPATLSTPVTTTVVAGTGTGLAAEYFNNITLAAPAAASRTDATVDFNWRYDSPIPGTINADVFSVRWSGQVQAPVSGTYVFSDICDDGVRLRVNGTLVIDNWTSHANTDYSAPISLTAGQKYDLVMEYFEGYSGAKAQLLWAYPGQGQQVIPQSRLYPATLSTPVTTTVVAGTGTGLAAEYFNNITLAAPAAASRTDATVDFNWRYDSPIPGTINADVFSVRWSGQVQAPVSGTYVFSDICDDGVRLRVNGTLVIDNWTSHANTDYSAPISLTAGQKYDLVMEYFEGYSGAKAQLLWAYPGQGQQVIPQSRLYPISRARVASYDNMQVESTVSVQVYPIPAYDIVCINYFAKEAGELSVKLVDLTGQMVSRLVNNIVKGENTLKISVHDIKQGVYLLDLIQGGRRLVKRIIIVH